MLSSSASFHNLIQKPLVYLLLLTGSLGIACWRDFPTQASLQNTQAERGIRIESPIESPVEHLASNVQLGDRGVDMQSRTEQNATAKAIVGFAIVGTGAGMVALTAKRAGYWGGTSRLQRSSVASPKAQANPRLQKQLLRLLHNDEKVANRLVAHAQRLHPGRSADWIVEKVIYDLQRDRGR
jgi:hypothetical protein